MKKVCFLFTLLVSAAFTFFFASCSAESKTDIQIPLQSMFNQVSEDVSSEPAAAVYAVNLSVTGDYEKTLNASGTLADLKNATFNIGGIPFGSTVKLSVLIVKDGIRFYEGTSAAFTLDGSENSVEIDLKRCTGQAYAEITVAADPKIYSASVNTDTPVFTVDSDCLKNNAAKITFSVKESWPTGTTFLWKLNGAECSTTNSVEIDLFTDANIHEGTGNVISVRVETPEYIVSNSFKFELVIK
ncbi:hypothetical protein [uncultured Treponema sp.]|uniref:hypothetical protein n=1 Tax=uncultured Treponema sp. TaxID=162155 RepID=UPI00259486CF|nr:hypothetical protein [uncultured Treponema sp.]